MDDFLRRYLKDNQLDPSYIDVIFKMGNASSFSEFSLVTAGICENIDDDLPLFVRAKKEQMESKRDCTHWPQGVCN